MELRVREATPADAPVVARVYVESWNDGLADLMPPRVLDQAQVARWSRDLDAGPVRWWPAERGASVVGLVGTGPSRDPIGSDLGELDTIAVASSAWRRGVGRLLMEAALGDLRGAGCRHAILWTPADHLPGRAFHTATGWHPSGEARDPGRQIAFRRVVAD